MGQAAFRMACIAMTAWTVSARAGDAALSDGIAACKSGRVDTALRLLAEAQPNPYLEAFRLYYRAESFSCAGRFAEAAADLDRLFELSRSSAIVGSHPIVALARERYVEVGLAAGSPRAAKDMPFDVEALSAHSLLMLSNACFNRGADRDGADLFFKAVRAGPSSSDSVLFVGALPRCEAASAGFSRDTSLVIARSAMAVGAWEAAERLIARLVEKDPGDDEALLARASFLAGSGQLRKALHALWRLFQSQAPIGVKKEALELIAGTEYRMKRYDAARDHYRMFGLYYPNDARASCALDTAARIAVLRGEWDRALEIWSHLRARRGTDLVSSEAVLSEGVLRLWRGRRAEANAIFRDLLPRVGAGIAPSVLYWLALSSPSADVRAVWSDSLTRRYPRSWYARAAVEGMAAFLSDGSLERQSDIGAIERRQKELRDSLAGASPVDESFAAGEPYQAYAYLVDHRLLAEAEQAARALLDAVHPTDREMLEIYRGAATHGLVPLAFHVLNRLPSSGRTIAMPWELWYPVSCSDLVREHAAANGLPADLLLAVIREESKFDTAAVSVDGARGLMQLLPSTTAWLASRSGSVGPSSEDLFAPSVNIAWGARFLSYLIGRYDGSVVGALAAYNAGEGRMRQWRESFDPAGDPLVAVEMIGPRETRRYVRQVLDALSAYRTIADGGRPQP